MRGLLRGRRLRRSSRRLALLAIAALLLGFVGVARWYPHHLLAVTGRPDLPRVPCGHCHPGAAAPPTRTDREESPYLSPEGLVVLPSGKSLFVTTGGANRLLEVDLERGQVIRTVALPGRPHGIAVSADGRRIAVSLRDDDRVLVLDAVTLAEEDSSPAGAEPIGLALSDDGRRLFVANAATDDLSIMNFDTASPPVRLALGNEPYALALSADGGLAAVINRLARPVPPNTVPASELTLVDARRDRILDRRPLRSAHLGEGVALSSDATFALATILRVRNLLPLTQVARGAVMNSAIAFVETRPGGRTAQLPLDEVNAFFADPSGIVLTPDDRRAFVAHGGARVVTAVDVGALRELVAEASPEALEELADDLGASARYVLARIPTRDNPRALALSPDGGRLFVAERLANSIAVIDTERLEVIDRIDLGGRRKLTPERRGERVFHDASDTFQGQFSCRSCHPDGHSDGLIWDFEIDGIGRNLVDTRSLRGVRDTAPFKWNGKNATLARQCGPRFARVLTRSDPFSPERLADLVAYIESIPLAPRRHDEFLEAARDQGRKIFFRTRANDGAEISVVGRCQTCHRPPLFTDRLPADVGSGGSFDTPHLLDLGSTAPYLHDGRALTLEEIWTVHSPDDTHGMTRDLTKVQLNHLVLYLRSL